MTMPTLQRIASIVLLLLALILFGLLDVWIMNFLYFSTPVVCFLHGIVLGLYALENWVMFKDLKAKVVPIIVLIEQNKAQVNTINHMTLEKQALEIERDELLKRLRRRLLRKDRYAMLRNWNSYDCFKESYVSDPSSDNEFGKIKSI